MYLRTIKVLAILLKWHRLLALHKMKSFPVSISSAVQQDPDTSWDIVLFCNSRNCGDYWQESQSWRKLRMSLGLPTSSHITEQSRGDKSLKVPRKKEQRQQVDWDASEGNDGNEKGLTSMFGPWWLLSGKAHQTLEISRPGCQTGWEKPQGKQRRKSKGEDILHESLVKVWALSVSIFRGGSTKELKSAPWSATWLQESWYHKKCTTREESVILGCTIGGLKLS